MFLRVIAVTTSLPFPRWHQVYIKNLIAKPFVHCPLFGFAFVPPCCALGHRLVQGTGPRRQAARLPPSSGRARVGRGTEILAEQKKPGVRYSSCGKGLLGRNVLPEGADLPTLHRLRSSFPRGVEGGEKKPPKPKNNPQKKI